MTFVLLLVSPPFVFGRSFGIECRLGRAGPITRPGNTAPEGIEVALGPENGGGSSGGIVGAPDHDRVAPAAEPGTREASRQVSNRNPSATLALLIVQQLQFLAMLSLVEYIVVEDSWLADFVISIR